MRNQLGMMFGISALMIGPAMAQNQPNPNQAAAKALLQAADKAIGASNVKSWSRYRHRLDGLSGPAVRPGRPAAHGSEEL